MASSCRRVPRNSPLLIICLPLPHRRCDPLTRTHWRNGHLPCQVPPDEHTATYG
jgi:hypothetical protein